MSDVDDFYRLGMKLRDAFERGELSDREVGLIGSTCRELSRAGIEPV